jgi:hypothetical protein
MACRRNVVELEERDVGDYDVSEAFQKDRI